MAATSATQVRLVGVRGRSRVSSPSTLFHLHSRQHLPTDANLDLLFLSARQREPARPHPRVWLGREILHPLAVTACAAPRQRWPSQSTRARLFAAVHGRAWQAPGSE